MSSSIDRELFSYDHNNGDRSGGDDHMETMIHFFKNHSKPSVQIVMNI